jgi:hypothetical protein
MLVNLQSVKNFRRSASLVPQICDIAPVGLPIELGHPGSHCGVDDNLFDVDKKGLCDVLCIIPVSLSPLY